MSAKVLRRAAAAMRENAYAACASPWTHNGKGAVTGNGAKVASIYAAQGHASGPHIASWHPAVALAVADWLDLVARLLGQGFDANAETHAALAVARAYLGGEE